MIYIRVLALQTLLVLRILLLRPGMSRTCSMMVVQPLRVTS